jgi:hypothetical protein
MNRRHASIAQDDALILPQRANPSRMGFSGTTGPLVPLAQDVSALLDGTAPAADRTTLARGPLGN